MSSVKFRINDRIKKVIIDVIKENGYPCIFYQNGRCIWFPPKLKLQKALKERFRCEEPEYINCPIFQAGVIASKITELQKEIANELGGE